MTFLYPQFLWALFALAVPIIIHFFSFRKVKVVYFSSVQFLKNVDQKTKNKRKIKHWLILLSRLLFLTFLILAFAQPTFNSEAVSYNRKVIFIDNSYSMSSEILEGQTAMDEAIVLASEIIDQAPFETQFQLVSNSTFSIKDSWKTKSQVKEALTELDYTYSQYELDRFVRQLNDNFNGIEVFVISDFQKNSYDLSILEGSSNKFNLVPISFSTTTNAYVDSVYLSSPFLFAGENNQLNISVRNAGRSEISDLQVKVLSGDQLVGTSTVSIPGKSSRMLEINIDADQLRSNTLKIELQDFPVTFDNEYWLSLSENKKTSISLITDNKNSYIESVYSNEQLFDLKVFSPGEIDYSFINASDLLVLEEYENVPDWVRNIVNTDIIVIPSGESDVRDYGEFLNSKVVVTDSTEAISLSIESSQSEFFNGVFSQEDIENSDVPGAVIKFRLLDPGQILLSDPFGKPYLSFKTKDDQRFYFLASSLQEENGNFQTHSLFVPVFYKIAQYSSKITGKLSYTNESQVIVFPYDNKENKSISMSGPSGKLTPNTRYTGKNLIIELPPDNLLPGVYQLIMEEDTVGEIALNLSKKESEMELLDEDNLKNIASLDEKIDIIEASTSISFQQELNEKSASFPLWKTALMLSLFFVFVEVLLVRFLK